MSLHERSLHEAERRSHQAWAMSAFVGKADIIWTRTDVRF